MKHQRLPLLTGVLFLLLHGTTLTAKIHAAVRGWPDAVTEEMYPSAADNTQQPTLFYAPESGTPVPLLVALHTWSNDYRQPEPQYAEWCIQKKWAMVHPNFRGPNNTPAACGSELAVEDILSVVRWAQKKTAIDASRIYLIGVSGGGYGAMLLAGRAPDLWAGVSAWAGIFDLRDWHSERQKDRYAAGIVAACGGAPGAGPEVDAQYRQRSASTWLPKATGIPIDIQTGIWDGHRGSVPVSHSLKAFNALAATADAVPAELITQLRSKPEVPEILRPTESDPWMPKHPVLFRKTSGNARITLFEGGHEIVFQAGLAWLEQQRKGRSAVWNIPFSNSVQLKNQTTESGK